MGGSVYAIGPNAGIIVDAQATAAHHTQDVDATTTKIERAQKRYGRKPNRLAIDTGHETVTMGGLVGQRQEDRAAGSSAGQAYKNRRNVQTISVYVRHRRQPVRSPKLHVAQVMVAKRGARAAVP